MQHILNGLSFFSSVDLIEMTIICIPTKNNFATVRTGVLNRLHMSTFYVFQHITLLTDIFTIKATPSSLSQRHQLTFYI